MADIEIKESVLLDENEDLGDEDAVLGDENDSPAKFFRSLVKRCLKGDANG